MIKLARRGFVKSCISALVSIMSLGIHTLVSGSGKNRYGSLNVISLKKGAKQYDQPIEPSFLKLHRTGELRTRGEALWRNMENCMLCPRMCGVNKLKGQKGFCGASSQLMISSFRQHYGEEKPLVGSFGSGTIFMTHCSLRCVFCCNWEISQGGNGHKQKLEDLAEMMLVLQDWGCPNINFVTPTHYSPHIILAVDIAAGKGLRIPLVYNTCGWERVEILKQLEGIVDIYLPDFKYADSMMAKRYSSGAQSYPELTKKALLEMHRQVGIALPGDDGLMQQGLMIRHLVMPNKVSGSKEVISWIAANLPSNTYLNIMSQYRPLYKARDFPELNRKISKEEYTEAVEWAKEQGLTNLDIQGYHF